MGLGNAALSGYAYGQGPGIALLVVGCLALVLRWIYGAGRASPRPPDATDRGLLEPAAEATTRSEAERIRDLLARHGIRSTLRDREGSSGPFEVLVFPEDLPRAARLVARQQP
jgi:hypothetical protein